MDWDNNKGRALGSGTNIGNRRQVRQQKQWSALQKADPPATSQEALTAHLEAMKKAVSSAEKQLEDLAKKQEEEDSKPLKKGKFGPRSNSKPVLVPAATLKKEADLKAQLEGLKEALSLKKDASSSSGSADPLKKESESTPRSLKKEAARPAVVVDWHNTIEVDDQVHPDNLQALRTLACLVDVHILSYVASKPRAHAFYKQVKELVPTDTLKKVKSTMVVWTKCGEEGKTDWACWLEAEALFDDQPDIISEAHDWGLVTFPIQGNKHHERSSYTTFAEACDVYLKKFDMTAGGGASSSLKKEASQKSLKKDSSWKIVGHGRYRKQK